MSSEQQDTAFDVQADESYWAALFTQEKKVTAQPSADVPGPSRAEFPFSSPSPST